jgi:hypothetical protein
MKQSTKRFASFTLAFALVLAALVVYFNFVVPTYEEGQDIKAQMLGRQDFIDNQKAAIDQTKKLIASYKGEGQLQQVVTQIFPLDPDLASAFAQLNGLIAVNRLSTQGVTVNIPVLQNAGVKNPNGQVGVRIKPLGTITLQARLIGTYEDFKSFLKNLETNIRIFDAEKIAVQPGGKPNQDLYIFDLTLNTYYQGN